MYVSFIIAVGCSHENEWKKMVGGRSRETLELVG